MALALVLMAFWSLQQQNVDSLQELINALKAKQNCLLKVDLGITKNCSLDSQQTVDFNKYFNKSSRKEVAEDLGLDKDIATLEQQRVSAQNAVYGSLIQALGGAFLFVTAVQTWLSLQETKEQQITERFAKSIELLGNENLDMRIGGIYALERISIDSEKDYWTIMEVLTSFIRKQAPLKTPDGVEIDDSIKKDVQAALTVIGRRDSSKDPDEEKIVLELTNLRGANLRKAKLNKAQLYNVKLIGADLREAQLEHANLGGGVPLRGANLIEANLKNADLEGADFGDAYLKNVDFTNACLKGVYLIGAKNLNQAIFKNANFDDTILWEEITQQDGSVRLKQADLSGVDLSQVKNLKQGQIDAALIDAETKLPNYVKAPNQPQSRPTT